MTEYEKIRAFEYDVLDQHYKNYLFYQYPDDIVIPYLLQTYGDTQRHRDNLVRTGHDETSLSFYLNNMLHGLGHCIRWMVNNRSLEIKEVSDLTYRQIHEMAADFLGWGTGYHMIAQEFVTWSRKIKKATLDEEKKTITFINPEGYEYSKIYGSQLLYAKRMADAFDSYPHEQMEKEFSKWIREIDFTKPPILNHIKWQRGRNSASYPLLYLKMNDILFPELNEANDFQGYNLQQLRQFYALVFLNFHFIRWVEAELDSRTGDDNLSFGSNPLELNQQQFEKFISDITGLALDVSRAIIADLTFDPLSFHTSVSIQPFIRSFSGNYHILPTLFAQLEPSRMILGALNKGPKKRIYGTLINTIEKVNLGLLYDSIKGIEGSIGYLEKQIKNNGQTITPDLILIDSKEKLLMVADYKHFIGPITASEVDYKMRELEKAINQLTKYIEHLSLFPKVDLLNIEEFSIIGLIITHKLLPVPIPKEKVIPIVDMESFMEDTNFIIQSNQRLHDLALKVQTDFAKDSEVEFNDFESEINVSEWIIKRTQHKLSK